MVEPSLSSVVLEVDAEGVVSFTALVVRSVGEVETVPCEETPVTSLVLLCDGVVTLVSWMSCVVPEGVVVKTVNDGECKSLVIPSLVVPEGTSGIALVLDGAIDSVLLVGN